jgi:hypothetical protein
LHTCSDRGREAVGDTLGDDDLAAGREVVEGALTDVADECLAKFESDPELDEWWSARAVASSA